MSELIEELEPIKLKPSLQSIAEAFGITADQFVTKTLTEHQAITVDFTKKLTQVLCKTMPGGLWSWPDEVPTKLVGHQGIGHYLKHPLKKTKLLVICPHAAEQGYENRRLPVYELQPILEPILLQTGIEGDEVYCCYAVPFYPHQGKVLSPFITAFQPMLHAEIERIKPEAILVLGSYALKGLFGSKGLVGNFQGKSKETYNGIPVHYTVDPFKLVSNPKTKLSLDIDLNRIIPLLGGAEMPWDAPQDYKDYRFVETAEELEVIIGEVLLGYYQNEYLVKKPLRIAVDTEWGNLDGREGVKHDIVRYIQFSTKEHTAVTVALTDPELTPYSDHAEKIKLLKALFEMPGVALCGHNFKVDLIHLFELGIDCRANYAFDTMTAYHFLTPQTESIGLTYCALEYTDLGNYESKLTEYIKGTKGLKAHVAKHAYSRIPDDVLLVYSCKDVDAVMQIWPQLEASLAEKKIDERYAGYEIEGNKCYTQLDAYLNVVKKADAGIFEPEYVGMPVDLELMKSLQRLYAEKKDELLDKVATMTWEGFNPDDQLLKAYLFDPKFCTKKLPEGIESLGLTPTLTTGKYPKDWDSLDEDELLHESPATGGDALTLLSQAHPEHKELLDAIIDFKAINQVVKNFLRPPNIVEDEDGTIEEIHDSGLIGCVDDDHYIRGTYLATTETGRFRSLKPNLNNLPGGAAEPGIRKQFGKPGLFEYPNWKECDSRELIAAGVLDERYDVIRSCVRANKSYILCGSDYAAAEMAAIAYVSGDENLISIAEDDSKDIHCETAKTAFGIQIPEGETTKSYIKANFNHLRTSSKVVLFGLAYGRGPRSLAKQLKVQGVEDADTDYAKRVIESIFNAYPKLHEYMERQRAAVYNPGYAENPFGMRRYFFDSPNKSVMAAQERASVNFPIQSCISGVLQLAMGNMAAYKSMYPQAPFTVMLPFHDAIYSMVHVSFAEQFAKEVIPWAMEEMAQVPSIGLKLKTDVEFEYHWSHPVSLEEAIVESLA